MYAKETTGGKIVSLTIQSSSKLLNTRTLTGNGGSFYFDATLG